MQTKQIDYDSFFVTTDGTYLYYEDHGQGDPILFIPGLTGSTRTYQFNVEELSKEHRVITFDARNYGRSSMALTGNSLRGQAGDVKDLIEFLHLENVLLIGWSLGGGVAATYSHLYKDAHLKGICFMDTHLCVFSNDKWNLHPSAHFDIYRFKKNIWRWIEGPEGRFANMAHWSDESGAPQLADFTEEIREWMDEDGEMIMPWAGAAIQFDYYISNPIKYLKEITVPVMILDGGTYGTCVGEVYREQIKTYCELHKFQTGHMLFIREARRVNRLIVDFCRKAGEETDETKADEAKVHEAKGDETKAHEAKADETKAHEAKGGETRVHEAKAHEAKTEGIKTEGIKTEEAKIKETERKRGETGVGDGLYD